MATLQVVLVCRPTYRLVTRFLSISKTFKTFLCTCFENSNEKYVIERLSLAFS